MTNIRTVSKIAGVSVATVSRTYSNPESVSAKTRKKVEEAVKKAGYRPNQLARNFRAKRSFSILVLVPNIANPFFSRVIGGIEQAAQARGYSILLGNTGGNAEREAEYANMVETFQADGVIQLSAHYPFSDRKHENGLPFVNICECFDSPKVPQVELDNIGAARAIINHLTDLGHTRIGLVKGPADSPLTRDRLKGCQQALDQIEKELQPYAIVDGDFSMQSGFAAADRLLALMKRPTAIFCFNDEMAMGVIRRVKDLGYDVPEDISVAGFDDIAFASYCDPPLTTIEQPAELFGQRAVEMLCGLIDGQNDLASSFHQVLPYKLVERRSTGTAPI